MSEYSHSEFRSEFDGVPGLSGLRVQPMGDSARLGERVGLPALLVLADLLAALVAVLLTVTAARALGVVPADLSWLEAVRGAGLLPVPLLAVALLATGGLYGGPVWEAEEIRRVAIAAALLGLVHLAFQLLQAGSWQAWTLAVWPVLAGGVVGLRGAIRNLGAVRRLTARPVLLVGGGIDRETLDYQMRDARAGRLEVLDAVPVADLARRAPPAIRALLRDSAARAGRGADRVGILLAPSGEEQAAATRLAARLTQMGQPFTIALPEGAGGGRTPQTRRVTGLELALADHAPACRRPLERAAKRAIDLVAAGAGLVVLAPAMLAIAALLRRDGDVFFAQSRIGEGGRRFRCLKFRSMHPDAEARLRQLLDSDPAARAEWAAHQKLSRDPRITSLGRFLRRTSLDELPQLINVLRGEMSLVGPRPMVAPEVPGYDNDHAYYHGPDFTWYAACRPGISGLWQISGRATTGYAERIRLDRWYARHWSIWLDIAILLKTLRVVLFSRTAS